MLVNWKSLGHLCAEMTPKPTWTRQRRMVTMCWTTKQKNLGVKTHKINGRSSWQIYALKPSTQKKAPWIPCICAFQLDWQQTFNKKKSLLEVKKSQTKSKKEVGFEKKKRNKQLFGTKKTTWIDCNKLSMKGQSWLNTITQSQTKASGKRERERKIVVQINICPTAWPTKKKHICLVRFAIE